MAIESFPSSGGSSTSIEADINVQQVGGQTATVGAGAVAAGTPRITLASDDPAVTALQLLDNAIAGNEMQVDVVAPLPAGTNAIGKLAANSGVDIGDVDVTSVTPGTGATNLGKAEDAAHTTGDTGVMALGVRNDNLATLAGTDLDYSPLAVTSNGAAWVQHTASSFAVADGTSNTRLLPGAAGGDVISGLSFPLVFNGTTWDRARGTSGAADVLAAARTLTDNGITRGITKFVSVVPVLDTSAYAVGDLLFDATEIANAARFTGAGGTIVGVSLIDADDQAEHSIDLLFFNATVDLGTLNAAPSASDADAAKFIGKISLVTSNDWTNNRTYSLSTALAFTCAATSLFVCGVNVSGTPTQTASGITLNIYIAQD